MSDFIDNPKAGVVVIPTWKDFPAVPDFADEPTRELALCWKCGPGRLEDGSREPRVAIFCECDVTELTMVDMEVIR